MNDITAAAPSGRQLIQSYGARNFRIAGEIYHGSVIILPETTITWDIVAYDDITAASFAALAAAANDVEILLIGCGAQMGMPRADIRDYLKEIGIVPEWMDTGAACRTFNVLVAEERRVAAAIIAVE